MAFGGMVIPLTVSFSLFDTSFSSVTTTKMSKKSCVHKSFWNHTQEYPMP